MHPVITNDFDLQKHGRIELRNKIVSLCDVLVEGPYIEKLKDQHLNYRGSSNQRVIDVQDTLKQGRIVLYCD